MCLVVDTCCLASVFDRRSKNHDRFAPVLRWITNGKGRLIYGGTKYNKELSMVRKFVPIVAELRRGGRAIQVSTREVDSMAQTLKSRIPDKDFDDEHIVALVIVSRCCVVCTDDKRAMPYLTRTELHREVKLRVPKIYQRRQHDTLCCDQNIVPICKN